MNEKKTCATLMVLNVFMGRRVSVTVWRLKGSQADISGAYGDNWDTVRSPTERDLPEVLQQSIQ